MRKYEIEVVGEINNVPLTVPEERLKETIDSFLNKGLEVIIHSVSEE